MDTTLRQILVPSADVELPVDLVNDEQVMKTFKLAFNWHVICDIKARTGKSILDPDTWGAIENEPEFLVVALHAALHLYQPELTLDEVKDMLAGNALGVADKMAEA